MDETKKKQAAGGTIFPVATTADLWPVIVAGLGGTPKPREGKFTPDGRPTYASQTILLVERDGVVNPRRGASVHVVEPASTYEMGVKYAAQGRVWVTPYESNSRVEQSITVERLVPVS